MRLALMFVALIAGCGRDGLVLMEPDLGQAPAPSPTVDLGPSCDPNACGDCGRPLVEECNGRDDDCDGLVDEGCPRRLLEPTPNAYSVAKVQLVGDRALVMRNGDLMLLDIPTGRILHEAHAIPYSRGVQLTIGPAALGENFTAWVESVSTDGNTTTTIVVRDHTHGAQIATRVDKRVVQLDTRRDHVMYVDGDGAAKRLHGFDAPMSALDARVALTTLPSFRLAGDWAVAIIGDAHDRVVARNQVTGETRTVAQPQSGESMLTLLAAGDRVSWLAHYPTGGDYRYEADLGSGTTGIATPNTPAIAISDALILRATLPPYTNRIEAIDRTTGRPTLITNDATAADVDGRRILYALTTGDVYLLALP